jgi:hypothetical protein
VPLPPVEPARLALSDGADLEIVNEVPADAAGLRMAVRDATLYCPGGRLDHPAGYYSAYVGLSSALHNARAATSFTKWVTAQRRITAVAGLALLRREQPYALDQLRYMEARVMQRLASDLGMIALTNTHTSAQMAASRLTRPQVLEGQTVADEVAIAIWERLFDGRRNPWPAPAPNTREQAVRVVQRIAALEQRAADVRDIVRGLRTIGHHSNARQLDFSVRRDLEQREPSRGRPRIVSVEYRYRRLFHPVTLSRRTALQNYDAAKPRP